MRLVLALTLIASIAVNLGLAHATRKLVEIADAQDKALDLYQAAALDGVKLADRATAAYDRCRGLRVVAAP